MEIKILFVGSGPADPENIPMQEKYKSFSRFFEGYIVSPVDPTGYKEYLNIKQIGKFKFFPFKYHVGNSFIRNIKYFIFTVYKTLKLHYSGQKYNIIISPNPLMTGIIALLVGKITSSKVIVEVNGNFDSAFKKDKAKTNYTEIIKHYVSKIILPFVLTKADMVKLVYKDQLLPLQIKNINKIRWISFANFVPISQFETKSIVDKKYILLLGQPWHLKGVDILIKAFDRISSQVPEYSLKVVGWCPEGRGYFEDLAKGNDKIELCEPVFYDEVIKLMSECSMYVLASRTDSSPRVLREAMASKKPIVASNIDGVPDLIIDKYNGLLFKSEDIDDLAAKMLAVLTDKNLATTIAENGYKFVHENLSEECYIKNYTKLIDEVFHDR